MILRIGAVALVLAAGGASHARAQDAAAGEKVFARCRSCHQVGPAAKNGLGPKLNGIVGAHTASVEGYRYSNALATSGLTWDEADLGTFLQKPTAKVPGTKMAYPGLPDPREVADVIAYLGRFRADGTTP